jgi:hypothetical protein
MSFRAYLRSLKKGQLIAAGIVIVLVLAAVGTIIATQNHSPHKNSRPKQTRQTQPTLPSKYCPLTDLPAPGGVAPQRQPLAVKIGNEEAARPQSGLNEADIVYDTPAEGGIQRYIAVFQCNEAAEVGPIRSVRWVDWHVVADFRQVELAYVGGITPNEDTVASKKWIDNANAFVHYGAYTQNPDRAAPDATYSSTAVLWKLFPARPAPQPIFAYTTGPLPTGAKPAAELGINFSGGTDVIWKWDASTGVWVHTYSGATDTDALTGQPVTTTNIVVEVVRYSIGPLDEGRQPNSGDVESQTVGTGPGWVLRNGEEIRVTWHRASLASPTTYTSASGKPVALAPGRTWVELVLNAKANRGAITFAP